MCYFDVILLSDVILSIGPKISGTFKMMSAYKSNNAQGLTS